MHRRGRFHGNQHAIRFKSSKSLMCGEWWMLVVMTICFPFGVQRDNRLVGNCSFKVKKSSETHLRPGKDCSLHKGHHQPSSPTTVDLYRFALPGTSLSLLQLNPFESNSLTVLSFIQDPPLHVRLWSCDLQACSTKVKKEEPD